MLIVAEYLPSGHRRCRELSLEFFKPQNIRSDNAYKFQCTNIATHEVPFPFATPGQPSLEMMQVCDGPHKFAEVNNDKK